MLEISSSRRRLWKSDCAAVQPRQQSSREISPSKVPSHNTLLAVMNILGCTFRDYPSPTGMHERSYLQSCQIVSLSVSHQSDCVGDKKFSGGSSVTTSCSTTPGRLVRVMSLHFLSLTVWFSSLSVIPFQRFGLCQCKQCGLFESVNQKRNRRIQWSVRGLSHGQCWSSLGWYLH